MVKDENNDVFVSYYDILNRWGFMVLGRLKYTQLSH
jgi:hypothetical protein